MLSIPNENEPNDGTDERPLVLSGDSAAAWELLLGLQYDRSVQADIEYIIVLSNYMFTALV
jgi:hypothetical protein